MKFLDRIKAELAYRKKAKSQLVNDKETFYTVTGRRVVKLDMIGDDAWAVRWFFWYVDLDDTSMHWGKSSKWFMRSCVGKRATIEKLYGKIIDRD